MKFFKKMQSMMLLVGVTAVLASCGSEAVGQEDTSAEESTLAMEAYETDDGNLKISLPGDDWTIDESSADFYVFSSSKGLVMISHLENASDELYPEEEDQLDMILDIEGFSSDNYEVDDFSRMQTSSIKTFDAQIHYTDDNTMYSSGILRGVLTKEDVYMASAMLKTDDEKLLKEMQKSLKNYVWSGETVLEPTAEATPEPTAEATPEPTTEATPEPTAEATPELTAEVTPVPESEITAVNKSGYCHSAAYVRDAPDNQSNIIGSVEIGDTVSVTGEIRNWYRISYQGGTAYICKDYVR